MCFSAQASFIAAGTLTLIGIATLSKVRSKSILPFALQPLIFGVQQALEGVLWLTLPPEHSANTLHSLALYGFLIIACIIWPLWVPYSVYLLEQSSARRFLLRIAKYSGIVFAIIATTILTIGGAYVYDASNHIVYAVQPDFYLRYIKPIEIVTHYIPLAFYCIATIGSLFVASTSGVWLLGVLSLIGFVTSYLGYYLAFGSVWCFFAAVSSAVIYGIVAQYHSSTTKN